MNRFLAITAAIVAVFLLPAIASAHTATPRCGGYLTLDRGSRTADIIRTDTDPDQLVWDDVAGNGTYSVVPGTYKVRWSDGYVVSHLEVRSCPNPSSSPTPTPTPKVSPSPSVPATPSPTPPSPSPTVTPAPSPTAGLPTPSATPIPSSSTPNPTLPPTSTSDEDEPSSLTYVGVVGILAALALVIGSLGIALRRFRG